MTTMCKIWYADLIGVFDGCTDIYRTLKEVAFWQFSDATSKLCGSQKPAIRIMQRFLRTFSNFSHDEP